ESEAPLQIRLIEARKSHARIHGNEERVDVLLAVVFVFEARDRLARRSYRRNEIDGELVLARTQLVLRQNDVPILADNRNRAAVDREIARRALAIVDEQRRDGRFELEGEVGVSGSGRGVRNQSELQTVMQVGDQRRALVRQLTWNTGRSGGEGECG